MLSAASAQVAAAQTKPAAPAAASAPAATPTPAATAVTPADEAPLDPSLAPPPPPAEILSNWQQALQLASAEDPDYSVALLEVTRLRGARRQTLAGTLPIVSASGVVTFALIRADLPNINPDTGELETITLPLSPVANFSVSLRQPLLAPRV